MTIQATRGQISKMSFKSSKSFPTTLFASLITVLSANGCAHFTPASSSPSRHPSDQVIKADPHTSDPLTALEQELTKVHAERVIVTAALLRSLVKNERLRQNQCKNISGQLEAIKSVDLEETGEDELSPLNSKEPPKEEPKP